MACLTAADIRRAKKRLKVSDPIPTPEWGDPESYVHVRELDGAGLEEVLLAFRDKSGTRTVRNVVTASMLAMCDAEGELLFSNKPEELESLLMISFAPFQRCADEIMALSGITPDASEELAGN